MPFTIHTSHLSGNVEVMVTAVRIVIDNKRQTQRNTFTCTIGSTVERSCAVKLTTRIKFVTISLADVLQSVERGKTDIIADLWSYIVVV